MFHGLTYSNNGLLSWYSVLTHASYARLGEKNRMCHRYFPAKWANFKIHVYPCFFSSFQYHHGVKVKGYFSKSLISLWRNKVSLFIYRSIYKQGLASSYLPLKLSNHDTVICFMGGRTGFAPHSFYKENNCEGLTDWIPMCRKNK